MAAKTTKAQRPAYTCAECGWTTAKWVGRCGECQAWGSVAESAAAPSGARTTAGPVTAPAVPIGQVPVEQTTARESGVPELDRVLGGGLVPGAAILLAGEPGVGKSTLLLEVAAQTARSGRRTLYVSGEESAAQVRMRADRTGAIVDELYLAAETDLAALLGHIEAVKPELLVVDSVQTVNVADLDGVPGGVTQVKEVTAALVRVAKTRNITTVVVGHVTKDGTIAGPRVLEHVVDVVLHFEGDRNSRFRMLRAMKNRFGPVDEVGCFDLGSDGITAVSDPTGLFVENHAQQVPGTCVAVTMEGRRPLLAEVQSLVTVAPGDKPRRTTSGLDSSRVAMVLAVLAQHGGLRLHNHDVFCSTIGGAKLTDPSTDLAIAISIASAHYSRPAPTATIAIGELGLAGELRKVRDLPQRLAEAARLGFKYALVPVDRSNGNPSPGRVRMVDGMKVMDVPDIAAVMRLLDLQGRAVHVAAASTNDEAG
ncbi:DNA repair protein RadA [Nocardioides jejuensis]|uniref:DNA repair protein RadA n=1 Tax=Nocardioides jejuensis TaxID=2502782 RepID=A0A4R1C2T8_9ACTN|nr:DNA repair protein RadA [Nocardioides jejuensis]TCJ24328.1 DNA repair protein RadA [Nocardioides jejuensis]